VLNRVYADVLNKPVLVPAGIPTSLGSGIFALLAAGAYKTIEEAQAAVCLPLRTVEPNPKAAQVYEQLYRTIAIFTLRWKARCRSNGIRCGIAGVAQDRGRSAESELTLFARALQSSETIRIRSTRTKKTRRQIARFAGALARVDLSLEIVPQAELHAARLGEQYACDTEIAAGQLAAHRRRESSKRTVFRTL